MFAKMWILKVYYLWLKKSDTYVNQCNSCNQWTNGFIWKSFETFWWHHRWKIYQKPSIKYLKIYLLETRLSCIDSTLINSWIVHTALQWCCLVHPEFGSSVNPKEGGDYAHHITACPPGFENLAASLNLVVLVKLMAVKYYSLQPA